MDGANWRPNQGVDPATVAGVDPNAAAPAGGDWRTQLRPEARSRIVKKIMETLKKHLPVLAPEGLSELQKIAVRFEEKIYTAATNQSDYLRKISLKMLLMESQSKPQQKQGNAQVIPSQNPLGTAPGLSPPGSNPSTVVSNPLDVSATNPANKYIYLSSRFFSLQSWSELSGRWASIHNAEFVWHATKHYEQQLGTKCSTRYICCTKANGRKAATATTGI